MTYLVAAFSWWTILLTQKNKEVFELKKEILEFSNPGKLDQLEKSYNTSRKMIIGEGLVFAITILVSLLLVNRAYGTEIKTNKKLNNFLLSVTHELKTPIASLQLINRTLLKKKVDEEKQLDLIQTAQDESLRLESLVNNILTVTQMDNNYNYNYENLDLLNLLNERVSRFQKIFPDFDISLSSSTDNSIIKGDYESLIKLVDNLVDNAIKYSADSNIVELEVSRENQFVILKVKDYGVGIADNEKSRIADKFYRIGDEDTRSSKGTGLGLFIVKEICKAHKAKLRVTDNTPKGSIFEIRFTSAT